MSFPSISIDVAIYHKDIFHIERLLWRTSCTLIKYVAHFMALYNVQLYLSKKWRVTWKEQEYSLHQNENLQWIIREI